MTCKCSRNCIKPNKFCQTCMPDELSWLVPVKEVPEPFLMDRVHAYITPENKVYVLDNEGKRAVELAGGGISNIDLSAYALKDDLVQYIAGQGIIIQDGVISTDGSISDLAIKVDTLEKEIPSLSLEIAELKRSKGSEYTAGQGLQLNNKVFSLDVTDKFTFTGNKLDLNLSSSDTNLISISNQGELNLTKLKQYIDKGDTHEFKYVHFIPSYLQYLPSSDTSEGVTYQITGVPNLKKLVDIYLRISVPMILSKGVKRTASGVTSSTWTNDYNSTRQSVAFNIPLKIMGVNNNYVHQTIRFPEVDMELTFSANVHFNNSIPSVTLKNIETYITTGKVINDVAYEFIPFIHSYTNFKRVVNGNTYEFITQHYPRVEITGLEINK